MNLFRFLWKIFTKRQAKSENTPFAQQRTRAKFEQESQLSTKLAVNYQRLKETVGRNKDLVIREFTIGGENGLQALAVFFEEMVDKNRLNRDIYEPLLFKCTPEDVAQRTPQEVLKFIQQSCLAVSKITAENNYQRLITALYSGMLLILIDGHDYALVIDTVGGEKRAIEEPLAEKSIRSPRVGFVEDLNINLSMLRQRLRDPKLIAEEMILGRRTRTETAIVYLEDLVDAKILAELKARLAKIDTDAVSYSGVLEQLIEDNPYTLFRTSVIRNVPTGQWQPYWKVKL